MGGLYFGVGKSLGSLIGGLLIEAIEVRNTFRCFSVLSLVAALMYFLFNLLLEKRIKDTDAEKSRIEKEEPVEDMHDPKIANETYSNDSTSKI